MAGVVGALLLACVLPLFLLGPMMRGAVPAAATQVGARTPGTALTVVVEITAAPAPEAFTGTVLDRVADGSYRRTGATLRVQWPSGTRLDMGTAADVAPGAVVEAAGTVAPDGSLLADRLVILTTLVIVQ